MITWEKEFDEQFANSFFDEKYMDNLELGERVKTFIQGLLHKQYERYDYLTYTMEKNLKLDEKKLDKILKNFYEHMCGVNDYGCKLCLKYKQQILDLQGEIK